MILDDVYWKMDTRGTETAQRKKLPQDEVEVKITKRVHSRLID